jgi:plastocyanin
MRLAILMVLSLFLALAAIPSAEATVHIVNQVNFDFQPDALTIAQGDTVRWVWSGGIHTVTNGTGAADPNVATLFDAPLSSSATTFQYRFVNTGVFPYFCRPHETLGMTGTITVDPGTPVEAATWGRIKRIFESADR